ncbi:MAG: hypothetical protein UT58_C0015G0019 [Microgenomates group bacterium GW2011_GWC1_39_7b]|uniref:Uncharacterized protein n=3 Tax=Candidatus Woeseibacteriota TaxID=1752722 RepID=A0A0G0P1S5_9BACT|nr:MAG: hypothetical protein UT17_C0003G0087 [Candidatus Woesebacteria bacterium GW2011_GWB1_39_10]KKR26335.1 MAG: hypothetical protein UT58_C0015G0019 [Microgenomates group bacterium GW2011_GWC1_39_7b]KKR73894.1 MAG: hypothetical protein UU16_C0011G0015 [Candidatus Woesebacteria bacterium GW2011_GWA2_40_7]KKS91024.1 MAG: hypothetical protein UV66_C0001G0381 [Candidatus Woesebacteria bacterium GW2011_GWA1_43_12]
MEVSEVTSQQILEDKALKPLKTASELIHSFDSKQKGFEDESKLTQYMKNNYPDMSEEDIQDWLVKAREWSDLQKPVAP